MTIGSFVKQSTVRTPLIINGVRSNDVIRFIKNGKEWKGDDDPMWRAKILSGRAAVNLFDSVVYREEISPLRMSYTLNGKTYDEGTFPRERHALDSFNWGSIIIPSQTSELSMLCLAEIRKVRDKFQGFTILGELRETLSMLRHPFKAITKRLLYFQNQWKRPVESYRARNLRHSTRYIRAQQAQFRDDLNNSYLELTFGLQPLIGDVEDIAKACVLLNQEPEIKRVFKKANTHKVAYVSESVFNVKGRIEFEYAVTKHLYEQFVIGVRRHGSDPVLHRRLLKAGSFETDDLIPAVYELIPWSWLVDYVTNLGSIIEAMTVDTSDVLWSSWTNVEERKMRLISHRFIDGWPPNNPYKIYELPSYSGSKTIVQRRNRLPNVGFDDFTSVFSLGLPGPRQVLNASVAIYQTFFRR